MSAGRPRLIPLDSPDDWAATLDRVPHAFAHTWENCHAMRLSTGLRTFLYVWENDGGTVVCPLSVREYAGREDLVTPYGFSGFVGTGAIDAFPPEWKAFATDSGYVCSYVQLNPLFQDSRTFDAAECHVHGSIYAVDLRGPEPALFARLSENRRREVRSAAQPGIEVLMDDERAERFFVEHYHACMRARMASPVYSFAGDTLTALLSSERTFSIGIAAGGVIEAVTLFGWTRTAGDYLFNVATDSGRRHSALLIWEGMKRLKQMEVPVLNLGGGIRAGDGVAQFKERFGGIRKPLCCVKQVFDAEAYGQLCRIAGLDSNPPTAFFPPYHRPHPVQAPG